MKEIMKAVNEWVTGIMEMLINFVAVGAVFEWSAGTKVKAPEILIKIEFEKYLDIAAIKITLPQVKKTVL